MSASINLAELVEAGNATFDAAETKEVTAAKCTSDSHLHVQTIGGTPHALSVTPEAGKFTVHCAESTSVEFFWWIIE